MIKVYRCRICGDPYIGEEAPTQCPFCGASQRFFVEANEWNPNEFNVELSEISKKNLQAALQLELDNAAFYDCAKKEAENIIKSAQIEAARSLAMIEDKRAIPALFKAWSDGSPMVKHWAEEGFERMGVGMRFFIPD